MVISIISSNDFFLFVFLKSGLDSNEKKRKKKKEKKKRKNKYVISDQ
jgi:hypothetical protein